MALAIGVTFEGGVVGVAALVLAAVLLGTAFAALSNALALVARQEETLIGAVSFLHLPLVFLSTAFALGCTMLATRAFRAYQAQV